MTSATSHEDEDSVEQATLQKKGSGGQSQGPTQRALSIQPDPDMITQAVVLEFTRHRLPRPWNRLSFSGLRRPKHRGKSVPHKFRCDNQA